MAHLAARRAAAALLRPTAAAPRLLPAAARFHSRPDYRAFVACLRDISKSVKADKNYFSPGANPPRDRADAIRATTHDADLVRVIEDTIRFQHPGLVEEMSNDFPFEIRKKEGLNDIILTRSIKGEQIEVLFSMPKLDQDEEGDKDPSNSLSSSSENQEDEGKTSPEECSLPIRVTVSKADGSGLEFACIANPDKIVIESLSMSQKPAGAEEDDTITHKEGTDFGELDQNLQEPFHKYLEVRGITPKITKLLQDCMISKDPSVLPKAASNNKRKNLVFLMKLSNFIKKD